MTESNRFWIAPKVLRKAIEHALAERGVLVDFREPDILRLAPVPLYNTFHDVWRLVGVLRDVAA